jgi:hypothetical protein
MQMTNLFTPKNGVAQWRTIYEHLLTMNIEDVVTDETLASLLPEAAPGSIRTAFDRAMREMETERSRTFDRVRKVGYRMVEAREHELIAQRHHKRSRRQLKKSRQKLVSADRSRLTADEKARFTALEVHVSQQQEMLRRLSAKQTAMQQVQVKTSGDVAAISEQVSNLTALLERHGITSDTKASA